MVEEDLDGLVNQTAEEGREMSLKALETSFSSFPNFDLSQQEERV